MTAEERREMETEPKTEEGEEEEEERGAEAKTMAPWEQHARIISMPRFDYTAPSSLLQRSHSGFLITCTIKREKSATKEAMSILGQYVQSCDNDKSEGPGCSDVNETAKRQKICTEEIGGKSENNVKSKDSSEEAGGSSRNEVLDSPKENTSAKSNFTLSLVKLTKSGLLLLTFPAENSHDTPEIVSNIFQSQDSGGLKSPLWCHRIFPVQATCILTVTELRGTVSKLVNQFVKNIHNKLSRPLKFAAGYNRRGMEETRVKISKDASGDSYQCSLLDRGKCFDAVAAGVKDIVSDSVVDLKSPELSVLVELLPLSGIPNGSFVAAVSVLPQNLVSTKPRLCIKSLVSETKARKGKS